MTSKPGLPERVCLDFYPPALAAQARPAHPASRYLLWTIVSLCMLALAWFFLTRVDVTVTATGTVIPSSRVRQLQPLETGIIKSIHVSEDQSVVKGQVLLSFEASAIKNEISSLVFRQAEFQNLLDEYLTLEQLAEKPQQEKVIDFASRHWREYQAGMEKLLAENAVLQQELQFANNQVRQFDRLIPLLESQLLAVRHLWKQQLASQFDVFELEQRLINLQSGKNEHQSQRQVLLQKQQAAKQAINHYRQQHLRRWAESIRQTRIELVDIQARLVHLQQRLHNKKLRAPVAGVVKQLSVRSIGEVANSGQSVLTLVPAEDFLLVEAFLDNQDIGVVSAGLPAEIKVQAFPFTRYGTLNAEVISISHDAIADEKRGLLYRLLLKVNPGSSTNQQIKLLPGMQVQAEIASGKRRLLDFFLSPLLKDLKESFRER